MQLLVGPRPRLIMNSRSLLASLLCASLASFAPVAAQAQLPPPGVSAVIVALAAGDAEPAVTSVLGLRSDDKKAGERLTKSLRAAFAEREMTGGQELTLEEVVLTLDCSSEEDTACMTEAGGALETEKLVYGSLKESGGSYVVEISVLDVTSGQVEAQGTLPFDKDALSAGNVDATATEVVNSLYPQADTSALPVAAPIPRNDGQGDVAEPEVERDSNYVWGPYKPRPAWKKVGLGVSLVIGVGGTVLGSVGWAGRTDARRGVNERKSEITQERTNPLRDFAGLGQVEFCDEAVKDESSGRRKLFNQSEVRDPDSASVCQDFLNNRGMFRAGITLAVVGGIATATFLTLFFVHKKRKTSADAQKRSLRLSGAPTRGGAMFGGYGRF